MVGYDNRSKLLTAIISISIICTSSLSALSCSPENPIVSPEPVFIGMERTAVNSLIYIAREKNYFKDNGLTAIIDDSYPSGAAAAEAVLTGKIDIATTAELFIVRQALAKKQILTAASIDMFTHMKLVAERNPGSGNGPELRGKKIGVPLNTAADFMLSRFLILHGIDRNQVTIVDVQSPQAVDTMSSGNVDAVVTWQPNVAALQEKLGSDIEIWDVQSKQPMYCVIVIAGHMAQDRPETVKRLILSLVQAEDFIIHNHEEAKLLIQNTLNYDDSYIEGIWPEHQYFIRLDQSLITAMEDQSRWMIAAGLSSEKQMPDFLDYIYEDALKGIRPEAVNIIH